MCARVRGSSGFLLGFVALGKAKYLVGLCEFGEVAAEEAFKELGLDYYTEAPDVVEAFAELRRLAVPGAESAARQAASFSGPMIEAARCAAGHEAKRRRVAEVERVAGTGAASAGQPPAVGMVPRWPTRLSRQLAGAGNSRARQEAEDAERGRWPGHLRDIVRGSGQPAAEMVDQTGPVASR